MAYSQLNTSTEPLDILLTCGTTVIVASTKLTRGQRQQSGPPVHRCLPCRPTKSLQLPEGEPTPYLISRVLFVELDFRGLVTLARYEQGPSTPVTSVVHSLSRAPDNIPLAGTVGSPDFLP